MLLRKPSELAACHTSPRHVQALCWPFWLTNECKKPHGEPMLGQGGSTLALGPTRAIAPPVRHVRREPLEIVPVPARKTSRS